MTFTLRIVTIILIWMMTYLTRDIWKSMYLTGECFTTKISSQAFLPEHQCQKNTKSFISISELKTFVDIFLQSWQKKTHLKKYIIKWCRGYAHYTDVSTKVSKYSQKLFQPQDDYSRSFTSKDSLEAFSRERTPKSAHFVVTFAPSI